MKDFKFDFEKMKKQFEMGNKKQRKVDERFWKLDPPTKDKKISQALIRFLPDKNNNIIVKFYQHYFQTTVNGQKKIFYEICPRTRNLMENMNETCPICNYVSKLYESPYESDKAQGLARKAKIQFISNIIVLKDPANPENEGKVFLFRYGRKIYDKLKDVWTPSEEDDISLDDIIIPFDPSDNGADFLLKLKMVSNFPNYDLSAFKAKSPLFNGDEEKIKEVINKTYDLDKFYKEEILPQIKTEEELLKKMADFGMINLNNTEDIEDDVPDEEIIDEETEENPDLEVDEDDFDLDEDDF